MMKISPFKICSKCKIRKSVEGFYRDRSKEDGRHTICKICDRETERLHLEKHGEEIRLRDRKRWQKRKENPREIARRLEYQKKWRTKEKRKAHNTTARKLRHLKPEICERCKIRPAQMAHHPDYSKPDEVEWICYRCHSSLRINLQTLGG